MIKLFSGPHCSGCKMVKSQMAKDNFTDYNEINTETDDGMADSAKYGVMSLPTLVVLDENESLIEKFDSSSCYQKYKKWVKAQKGVK